MQITSALALFLATAVVADPAIEERSGFSTDNIVALFTDSNNADSRADIVPGRWSLKGFAEWPIHVITQTGSVRSDCLYTGAQGGSFKIKGNGKVKVTPPQHITDVNCSEL